MRIKNRKTGLYPKYEIEGDAITRLNIAIKTAKQMLFSSDPNGKNIEKEKYSVIVGTVQTQIENGYKNDLKLS